MANVLIYTTPTCMYCKMAKEFFKEHDVDYIEKNVIEDTQARQEMMEKSEQMGVPVIDIDGEITVGFDKPRLAKLLKIQNNGE